MTVRPQGVLVAAIARAAAEDAEPVPTPSRTGNRRTVLVLVTVATVVVLLLLCAGVLFFAQSSEQVPAG